MEHKFRSREAERLTADATAWVCSAGVVLGAVLVAGSLLGSYAGVDHRIRLRLGGADAGTFVSDSILLRLFVSSVNRLRTWKIRSTASSPEKKVCVVFCVTGKLGDLD